MIGSWSWSYYIDRSSNLIGVKYIHDEPLTESLNDNKSRSLPMSKSHFFDKKILKNTENHWLKLLFLQMSLKLIIIHDAFLTENLIPWLFTDFYKHLRFFLTFYKIPWLFPDLEKFLFSPVFSLTVVTLNFIHVNLWKTSQIFWRLQINFGNLQMSCDQFQMSLEDFAFLLEKFMSLCLECTVWD